MDELEAVVEHIVEAHRHFDDAVAAMDALEVLDELDKLLLIHQEAGLAAFRVMERRDERRWKNGSHATGD